MTVLTCASTGKSITLLGEPKISGEAKVWQTNRNGYLAKIYHDQKPERVQKLAVMIAHRPKEPNSHLNHISFAWPKSVLKDAQGNCVGFLMPEIKEGKELIDIYNRKRRKDLKLEVDWRFFHTTALNIASIIEAIHISGYVLGDIKPQNILVNDRALPSIIDTDSFQVRNPVNSKVYRCLVGSEGFTPPELIDQDFSSIDQTEVHDRFRLAVIIYQLLFGGQSPFAGKWIGAGETPETNELIRRGLWLYAPNSLIQPVERIIPLEIVHPEVQRCFLRCFNDGYQNPNLRPTAGDWVKALRLAINELTICGKVDSHYYSRTYGKCYWCDRSTKLSIDIFPGFARPKQQSAFSVSTSQPEVFAAEKTLEIVNQQNQIISVIGRVTNTHYHTKGKATFFINFGNYQVTTNGYFPFTIVIFDEGLQKLCQAVGQPTVSQLISWSNSIDYVEITGCLKLHQKYRGTALQIILKEPEQLRIISQNEANKLLGLSPTTPTSSTAKPTQSKVSQPAASAPHTQPVITQAPITSPTTTTSSPIQPTQSQVSQTNQSANLSSPNNYSKQNIFQSAVSNSTSLSGTSLSAKTSTSSNTTANNTLQQLPATKPIQNNTQLIVVIGSVLASATLGLLMFFAPGSLFPSSKPLPLGSSSKPLPLGAYRGRVSWAEGLSLRSQPNQEAERIGGVGFNEKIIILSESEDKAWQKIRLEGSEQEGWVKAGNTEKEAKHDLTQSQLKEIANTKIEKYIIGIGISFQLDEKTQIPTVTNVFEKSPAALGNIKVGDQIIEINGISTLKMSTTDVASLIQGDISPTVFLLIRRSGFRDTEAMLTTKSFINTNVDKDYVKRCSAHFQLQDYSDALNDCDEAININPNNDEAYFLRGASHYLNGNKYQGMEDFQKAASLGNEGAKEILKDVK